MDNGQEWAAAEVSRTVKVEAREILGRWHVRVWATADGPEGYEGEPFVIAYDFATLDLVGSGWQALAVMDETIRRLSSDLRAGYE